MKCKKCDGLMVLQSFFDHFLNFDGWKCLNCGKIIVKKEKSIEFDAFSIFTNNKNVKIATKRTNCPHELLYRPATHLHRGPDRAL